MKLSKRAKLVRAMELLARAVNDESIFDSWLMYGVADGDIDGTETDEDLEYYCEDADFAELMHQFLGLMAEAYESGGLYCDGVTSGKVCECVYDLLLSTYEETERIDVDLLAEDFESEQEIIEYASKLNLNLKPNQCLEVEKRFYGLHDTIDCVKLKVPRYLYNVVLSTYNEAETVREDVVELELEIEDEETAIEVAKHQKVVLEPHQRVEVERRDFDSYNLIDIIEVN